MNIDGKDGLITKLGGMVKKPLKILVVAVEAAPYATVGGFSRVVDSLSKALLKSGNDVRIFMPKFGFLDETRYKTKMVIEGLRVPTSDPDNPELICNVKLHVLPNGVPTYFLENMEYYEKRANVYGYSDDPTRWALLSRGALEFIKSYESFLPDVIHCNDWHTGILPNYQKTLYKDDSKVSDIATLFTIHNLTIQGIVDFNNGSEMDFDDGKSDIASFFSENLAKQNFMKRGIVYADAVNTVSPTYSKEILTSEFGGGLDKLLMEMRSKLYGVLNGLDFAEFDPATDEHIEKNFDIYSLDRRAANKIALQKEFGITVSSDKPLLGFVGRLDYQKGVDLIIESLFHLIKEFDVQFIQVGGGDVNIVNSLKELKEAFPKNVGLHPIPNWTLPRLMFAGCDMILYPSRFEPCGIVQLEAMRYGAIPIVRKVGGLADTVENFNPETGKGTGFVFEDYNLISFYGQLVRAVETFKHKDTWRVIQKNAMREDFSWFHSAFEYVKIYKRAIEFHRVAPGSDSSTSNFGM